ncbi:MAG TPA: TIGR01906 family membrane protein [Chloroflexota bacterium]|nr:TIGR01906 family membrane protein [Chloroflexota bacterium]
MAERSGPATARRGGPRGLLRLGAGLATALCVVALPLGLVAANVRAVTLDRSFYLTEFARYDRGAFVGLAPDELRLVADAFIAYFQGPPSRLDVRLPRGGTLQPLFNERELAHMEDVQALMHLVFRVQALAFAYVALYALGGLAWGRRAFLPLAAKVLVAGGVLTLGIIGVLGALAATDFSDLFLEFHLLSFSNDLWLLDPRTDNLIRLFPQEFFLDAAMRVVVFTVVEALALAVVGLVGLLVNRRTT